MDEDDFLSRIYDLRALPTTDYRRSEYPTAAEDIHQHRVNNRDWDDDWVFGDSRFNLRHIDDSTFIRFLVETVHPTVRRDAQSSRELVAGYNDVLRRAGFEIVVDHRVGEAVVYRAQERSGTSSAGEAIERTDLPFAASAGESEMSALRERPVSKDIGPGPESDGSETHSTTLENARNHSGAEPVARAAVEAVDEKPPENDSRGWRRRRWSRWHTAGVAVVSFIAALIIAALIVETRVGGLTLGLQLLIFAIPVLALSTSVLLLLTDWRVQRALVTGAGGAAVLIGLVLALMQVPSIPPTPNDSAPKPRSSPTPLSSTASPQAPKTPSSRSPSVEPTLVSGGATERLAQDRVLLGNAQSVTVDDGRLRLAASNVYSTFAHVLISTDERTCDSFIDVGQVLVVSDRASGETDYTRWYTVVIERIDGDQASLVWSVGTGRAPAAEPFNDCL